MTKTVRLCDVCSKEMDIDDIILEWSGPLADGGVFEIHLDAYKVYAKDQELPADFCMDCMVKALTECLKGGVLYNNGA